MANQVAAMAKRIAAMAMILVVKAKQLKKRGKQIVASVEQIAVMSMRFWQWGMRMDMKKSQIKCGKCFGSGEGETVYVCVAKPIKTVAVAAAMTTPTPAVKRLLAEEVM